MKIVSSEKGLLTKAALCSIGVAFLAVYVFILLSGDYLRPAMRLALCMLACLFIFLGVRIRARGSMTAVIWFMFLMYLSLLLTLTLFDPAFGRSGGKGLANIMEIDLDAVRVYASTHRNFVPFETMRRFYSIADRDTAGRRAFIVNVIGNAAAFMPFAFFLPVLFKKLRKFRFFIVTMLLTVAFIETAQIILMTGSFDTDDIILNCGGAAVVFFILRFPPMRKSISRLTMTDLEK